MKKLSLFCSLFLTACFIHAQVLPEGMEPLFGDDVTLVSSYYGSNMGSAANENTINRALEEKPIVSTSNGLIFFSASTVAAGEELWVSDGTPTGTKMVKDITSGTTGSNIQWLTAVGNKVYFAATTPEYGAELWVSDGTEAGTQMVKDIKTGTGAASPQAITAFGDKALFFALDNESGTNKWLYISDGTDAGTIRLAQVAPKNFTAAGTHGIIVSINGIDNNTPRAVFAGGLVGSSTTEGSVDNNALWATDGTPAGTTPIATPVSGSLPAGTPHALRISSNSTSTEHLVPIDGRIAAFRANTTINPNTNVGREMWITDGTAAGTKWIGFEIVDGNSGGENALRYTFPIGNKLFFRANNTGKGDNGTEPWFFNIDEPIVEGENPRLIVDLVSGGNSDVSCFYEYEDYLFMAAGITYNNGGNARTASLHNLVRGKIADFLADGFNTNNSAGVFEGMFQWAGFEIGQSNPEYTGTSGGVRPFINKFCEVGDRLFFAATDVGTNDATRINYELWSMEGADGIPAIVVDFPDNGQISYTMNVNDVLYFSSNSQKKIYKYDFMPDDPSTSLASPEKVKISIYPNPVSDMLEIKSLTGITTSSLSDLSGRVVYRGTIENTIDVSSFSKGIYLLSVTLNDNSTHTTKVVVK